MSTMMHFLRYSLRHGRPVKVLLMPGQEKPNLNLTVTELTEEGIHYLSARNKKTPRFLPFDALLSAGYARGDQGDMDQEQKG